MQGSLPVRPGHANEFGRVHDLGPMADVAPEGDAPEDSP